MKKTTFWAQDSDGPNKHLNIVISDPDVDNKVMTVHITRLKNTGREDLSCVLKAGDHQSIVADSYVRYDKARELDSIKLVQAKFGGQIIMRQNVSVAVLKKLQQGAKVSSALPIKFCRFFQYF